MSDILLDQFLIIIVGFLILIIVCILFGDDGDNTPPNGPTNYGV